jgi:hypothetical protein
MESIKGDLTYIPSSEHLCIAKEDITHHCKVFGTASTGVDLSPVACVERGFFPVDYLDSFTSESKHFNDIQNWKMKQSNK